MARKLTALVLSIILASAFLVMTLSTAAADPIQDKKNQLEQIKNEVQKIDARLESITEQYNMTSVRVQQTRADISRKEAELASLTATLQQRKGILGDRLRGALQERQCRRPGSAHRITQRRRSLHQRGQGAAHRRRGRQYNRLCHRRQGAGR